MECLEPTVLVYAVPCAVVRPDVHSRGQTGDVSHSSSSISAAQAGRKDALPRVCSGAEQIKEPPPAKQDQRKMDCGEYFVF